MKAIVQRCESKSEAEAALPGLVNKLVGDVDPDGTRIRESGSEVFPEVDQTTWIARAWAVLREDITDQARQRLLDQICERTAACLFDAETVELIRMLWGDEEAGYAARAWGVAEQPWTLERG